MPFPLRPFLFATLAACGIASAGQFEDFVVPDGATSDMHWVKYRGETYAARRFAANSNRLYFAIPNPKQSGGGYHYLPCHLPKLEEALAKGDKIFRYHIKRDDRSKLLFITGKGDVYMAQLQESGEWGPEQYFGKVAKIGDDDQIQKLVGDDLYALTSKGVSVTHDFKTWERDTAGLGAIVPLDIDMDTAYTAWAATSKNVLRKPVSAAAWEKAPGWTEGLYAARIFADRSGRILVATSKGTFLSVDHGATFSLDTAGMGNKSALGFGDDVYGNLYALASPDLVFVSKGGTGPWVKSVSGLEAIGPAAEGGNAVLAIAGDTLVCLSTTIGNYTSADQGATWIKDDSGITDPNLSLMRQLADGSVIASNALGLFRRPAGSDAWGKVFPDSGYLGYRPFFEDSSGAWHTLGRKPSGKSFQVPMSRNGVAGSWAPDTQGISAVTAFNTLVGRDGFFFADRQGTLYLADVWTTASGPKLWTKRKDGAWSLDTAGLGTVSGASVQGTAFVQEAGGDILWALAANSGCIMRRGAAGGTWTADTAGLEGSGVYSMAQGKDGKVWAGTIKGLYFREGGSWHKADLPAASLGGMAVFAVAVDKAGAVWAGYSNFQGYTNPGLGAYFSNDNGKTWTLAGLPYTTVRTFFPVGDTIRASTYGLGIYGLTKTALPIGIVGRASAAGAEGFRILPGPFADRRRLEMRLSASARVMVEFRAVNGSRIATAFSGLCGAGSRTLLIDTSELPPGMHILSVSTSSGTRAGFKFLR